jgi:hypothetical protein
MTLMRSITVIAVLLLSALSGSSCGEKPKGNETGIKVCSFNIRYDCNLRLGPAGTFNEFNLTGTFDRRIDFVFHKGFTTERYITGSMVIDNQYLSDHFPVITVIK